MTYSDDVGYKGVVRGQVHEVIGFHRELPKLFLVTGTQELVLS